MDQQKKSQNKMEALKRALKLRDIELQKFQKSYKTSPIGKSSKRPNSANYNKNDETLKHSQKY